MINNYLALGILLVVVFVATRVNSVKIEFSFKNHTELNFESNSTANCNNIPADRNDIGISAIKTDTCLMVYSDPNCYGASRKFDLDNNLAWPYPYVRSFHICNDHVGGDQLKIDFSKYYDIGTPTKVPDALESYADVCTCINVPKYVQNMHEWSANNYGNDFLAYFEPDCLETKQSSVLIPAGNNCNPGSRCMSFYTKFNRVTGAVRSKIQSIGPNPNSKYYKNSCKPVMLTNKIFERVGVNEKKLIALTKDLEMCQRKHNEDFVKIEELEAQIKDLNQSNKALEDKSVEFEFKLENQYRTLEDSIEKLKDELNYFTKRN